MRIPAGPKVVTTYARAACVLAATMCACGSRPSPTVLPGDSSEAGDSREAATAAPVAPAAAPALRVDLALSTWTPPREVKVASAAKVSLETDQRGWLGFPPGEGRVAIGRRGARVCVDSNGDGKADRADGRGTGVGKVLRLPLMLDGRRIEYPARVVYASRGEVRLASAAALTADVEGHRVALLDPDMDGRFGEAGRDRIVVDRVKKGSTVPEPAAGPAEAGVPMGKIHAVGDDIYAFKLIEGMRALELTPVPGEKALAVCAAAPQVEGCELFLRHREEPFETRLSLGKRTAMLAGDYDVPSCGLTLRLEGGVGRFSAARGAKATVKVATGSVEIRPGPPFTLDFAASLENGTKLVVDEPALVGGAGERYRPYLYVGGERSTLEVLLRSGGEETSFGKLEYG